MTIAMFRPHVEIDAALQLLRETMASGYIGEGPRCADLERRLAEAMGFPRVLLVNSGTAALRLALHLAGARPGVEVVSTPMTCLATNTAILETGARIVWADIDPDTGNIDTADVVRKVSATSVAVMAVDWGGRVCDFGSLRASLRGLSIIEDAAHAFGAQTAARGDFICFSFQAIKHFTTGDGGALVCPGAALSERARLLRWFGLDRTRGDSMRCYQSVSEAGFKMQLNDLAACVGLANLDGARGRVERCRENARFYHGRLANLPYVSLQPADDASSWWFFGIKVSQPIVFERFMAGRGIMVGQVHARNDLNPCFDHAQRGALPGVDAFSAHQTNLPCGWFLTPAQLEEVARAVEAWSKSPEAKW